MAEDNPPPPPLPPQLNYHYPTRPAFTWWRAIKITLIVLAVIFGLLVLGVALFFAPVTW